MQFKSGVRLDLQPLMAQALPIIDDVTRKFLKREAIITAGTDGKHKDKSKHYLGLAVDLRTFDIGTSAKLYAYARALNVALNINGHLYDVVVEWNHIHIEYDKKEGVHDIFIMSKPAQG